MKTSLPREGIMKPKNKTSQTSQVDLIKSVRRELPPKGQVIPDKRKKPFRKRKHKGQSD